MPDNKEMIKEMNIRNYILKIIISSKVERRLDIENRLIFIRCNILGRSWTRLNNIFDLKFMQSEDY